MEKYGALPSDIEIDEELNYHAYVTKETGQKYIQIGDGPVPEWVKQLHAELLDQYAISFDELMNEAKVINSVPRNPAPEHFSPKATEVNTPQQLPGETSILKPKALRITRPPRATHCDRPAVSQSPMQELSTPPNTPTSTGPGDTLGPLH